MNSHGVVMTRAQSQHCPLSLHFGSIFSKLCVCLSSNLLSVRVTDTCWLAKWRSTQAPHWGTRNVAGCTHIWTTKPEGVGTISLWTQFSRSTKEWVIWGERIRKSWRGIDVWKGIWKGEKLAGHSRERGAIGVRHQAKHENEIQGGDYRSLTWLLRKV